MSGFYVAGERLQEAKLAALLHTSKTPVREALARLVQEGFLEALPRIGYIVRTFDRAEARDLLEYRELLETAAVQRAATYITDSELQEVELLHRVTFERAEPSSRQAFLSKNRDFHLAIAKASRNGYLARALAGVYDQVDHLVSQRLHSFPSSEAMTQEHRVIVEALRARDPEQATAAILLGLRNTREAVLSGTYQ